MIRSILDSHSKYVLDVKPVGEPEAALEAIKHRGRTFAVNNERRHHGFFMFHACAHRAVTSLPYHAMLLLHQRIPGGAVCSQVTI